MVFVFCIAVSFLIVASLTVKFFFLLKASLFDGQHRFSIFVTDTQGTSEVISFAPDTQTISMLILPTERTSTKKNIERFLGIPIDGFMHVPKQYELKAENDVVLFARSAVFEYKTLLTNLTIIDTIRLWFFAKSIPTYSIVVRTLNTSLDNVSIADQLTVDKRMLTLFGDESFAKEKVSIQIVNGTGIVGLGNRLARMITNMGGNVVAVSTAGDILQNSQIAYYGKETYTVKKLNKILPARLNIMQKPEISDIIVTIGRDLADQF